MRQFALLLVFIGIASCVVRLMDMEMRLLMWIDTWGEAVAWGIRGGFIAVGALLLLASKPKAAAKS